MAWNQDFGEGARPGSEREQQSWRDSFNGGKAAGDWTGNHNARLDAERAAFGTTWSGSSSQPSALQLAQSFVGSGPAVGAVAAGGPANSGVGPGNGVISTAPAVPTKGPGRQVVVVGGKGPLEASVKDSATGGWAGFLAMPNPWFSDVEEWWEPRYGEPGEWLGGIVNIAADTVFNTGRVTGFDTDKLVRDVGNVIQNGKYDRDKLGLENWSPFWEVNASARFGSDGTVFKTGGGF